VCADSEKDVVKKVSERYKELSFLVGLDHYVIRESVGMGVSIGVA